MNPQEIQQVVARDEKWVPFIERVKISSTNVRLETTMPQEEETFQVGTDSYEFLLANKKCVVNADVFRMILDICPRVEGLNLTDVLDDDTTLAFLIKLGYKDPLYKHTNMFMDHMHQPWRTLAAIINKCLSGKTASNDKLRKLITRRRRDQDVKICHFPDSPRLNFVRIGEDYQEYRLLILETMLTEAIKQSESYQMFIKYSIGQIPSPPRRAEAKSEPEPEPVKRKTYSKRRVKKKVILSADDNIISDNPGTALELGKCISKTEAEEGEAARQVNVTHARIVTESVPEPTRRRRSGKVTTDSPKKLKGVPSLTPEEQKSANIMQALKESKKTSKRQPGTGGSSEGTGTILRVPNESTIVSTTSSKGTGTKPGVLDEEKDITKENAILEWGSKQESEHFEEDKLNDKEKDDKEDDADDEDDEIKYDEDDIYNCKIHVHKDEDEEEMLNAEVKDSNKGDEEVDAAKEDAEKTSEVKDDSKKTKLPLTSSSLSVSLGFGHQFLKLLSDSSLVSTVKDTTDT
ncbi:hypothetical protein Tco_0897125 [Tanacetum coccineum]